MKQLWPAFLLFWASACVVATQATPDARPEVEIDTDASRPFPGFRDAGGCGGGTSGGSGTSGSGCRDAGAHSTPDATPCDVHTFTYDNGAATNVWVTGSFTTPAWADEAGGALQMTKSDSVFRVTTAPIGSGPHSYKFIIEGQAEWIPDPANGATEPDGFGGSNSVLTLCGVN